jgi:lipopolysaccharide export system permease protein
VLTKIDKYILKNFIVTFIFCIIAFTLIAIVIDYTEKIEDFVNKKVPLVQILLYFKNFAPYIIALLFPIFIFVSVIFFTSKMANRSEVIAILATGMEFKRFLRPYFVGAALICATLLFANHIIIPRANKLKLEFEKKYIWEHDETAESNSHLRISPNEFVFIQSFNTENKTGYKFCYEKIVGTQLIQKIRAERCEYDSIQKNWKLFDVVERINDTLGEKMTIYSTVNRNFALTPNDLIQKREAKQLMTSKELNAFINKEKAKGAEGLNEFYIEKYRRTASPFCAFVLTIIGACIASRKVRGGSGIHLALGLGISAMYIILMQFSTTFSTKGNLHPLIAVWIPNIFFTIVAIYTYRKFSK